MTSRTPTIPEQKKSLLARFRRLPAAFLPALILAGCGGGGSGGGGGAAPVAMIPTAQAPESPITEPVKPAVLCTIQLEGDSILYGYIPGGRLAEPPAAALKRQRPAYDITDRSVPGNSVQLRMPGFMAAELAARFVVLEFGINDGGQGQDYKEPLRAMVQRVKAKGQTPIITGLSRVIGDPPFRDAYNALAQAVASEEGAPFADWGSAAFDPADMADDVHPGPAYSARLVAQLVKALDKAAPECAQ